MTRIETCLESGIAVQRFLCLGRHPEGECISGRFVEAYKVDAAVRVTTNSNRAIRLSTCESDSFVFETRHQLELWRLLLGGVFLHPRLGFLRGNRGMSPEEGSLERLGIDEAFIEQLCSTLKEYGTGTLFSTTRYPRPSVQTKAWQVVSTARLACCLA